MKRRFSYPLVYCISEGDITAANYHQKKKLITDRVRRAAGRGVDLYQIREKDLSGRLLFDLASAAVEAARGSETRILINGRADIALAARADGVHLPANGVPVRELRGCVPEDFLIGASTHSIAEAEAAFREVLARDPSSGDAHHNLALVLTITDRLEEAEREITATEKAGVPVHPRLKQEFDRRKALKPR